MSRGRLVFIAGTRPELIKTGPVVAECRAMGVPMHLVLTGQHTTLLDGCPAIDDWSGARSLGLIGHPDPLHYVTRATAALQDELEAIRGEAGPIACVVVQGDTGTALAGARAAAALRLPVAHIEAGLRSHCMTDPWPEEGFRIEIDRLAHWHFCPTPENRANLLAEGISGTHVYVTGNPVVSALARYCPKPIPTDSGIIITLHRRELLQKGHGHLTRMIDALIDAAHRHPKQAFRWPMHPSFSKAMDEFDWDIEAIFPKNVVVSSPWAYIEMIYRLAGADGLITDSGGLTEEATTLGTPLVTLRDMTDRPEASGIVLSPIPEGLTTAINWLALGQLRTPNPCFGSPDSASTIASLLAQLT